MPTYFQRVEGNRQGVIIVPPADRILAMRDPNRGRHGCVRCEALVRRARRLVAPGEQQRSRAAIRLAGARTHRQQSEGQ